ncbi:replicase protein [Bemisia-associated dicistrovirus 2]|nr:replicase protein [Bemisia-associated dicistrovirus 2]
MNRQEDATSSHGADHPSTSSPSLGAVGSNAKGQSGQAQAKFSSLMNTNTDMDDYDYQAQEYVENDSRPNGFKRFYNFIKKQLSNAGLIARDIGMSAIKSAKDFIGVILDILKPYFTGSTQWIWTATKRILLSLINQIWSAANECINTYRALVCSAVSTILAAVAVCMPSSFFGWVGRVIFAALAAVVYFAQSYLAAGVGLFLLWVIGKFMPTYTINMNIENNVSVKAKAEPQAFKEETTRLILDIVSLSVIFSASVTGLSFPTDAKSWDDMMKRHALLHRSMKAWEFGAEKLAETFESVARYIFKYAFGKEFVSFDHIGEVEKLYDDVIELTRLDINVDIGRDLRLTSKIERLYAQYLNLQRIYFNNRPISTKLQKIGGPLTEFYRRVADKNPKAHVMRKEPVCMAIYGPTGIGKSYLMSRMQQDLLKIAGKFDPDSPTDGLVYARAIEQEFWDGYTGQPIAIYDDFAQKVDSAQNPNNEFFEIIRAVNIFPYQLHSAAIQEKANNPFSSDFVILTTNLENFRPKSIISEEAFTRRIHIDCKINLIDEVKSNQTTGMRLDLNKLRLYQEKNGLPHYDLSHLSFNVNDQNITYEQFIILVSLQYKKHVEAFQKRQDANTLTAHCPLPEGAYSVQQNWAQPQSIDVIKTCNDIFNDKTRPMIRKLCMDTVEFNRTCRTTIYNQFENAERSVKLFVLECISEMDELRLYVRATYGKYLKFFCTTLGLLSSGAVIAYLMKDRLFTKEVDRSEVESSMKVNLPPKKTILESPNKVQVKPKTNLESNQEEVKAKQALLQMFPECESGRSDDSKRKRTVEYEGIRSQQVENLKSLVQRNQWILYSYVDGEKREIGFVTVLKGHKALMNHHYFQILVNHFKNIPLEKQMVLFAQPGMLGGHTDTIRNLIKGAQPLFRGEIQTEFYIITMPKTCNIGRDLTKHLIQPKRVANLTRGVPLHLSTYRKDSNDFWRPTTVAGFMEEIKTAEVYNLNDRSQTHQYLESVYYIAPSTNGDCGNPVFIDSDEFEQKLLGFHFAGEPGKGICAVVTAQDLEKHLSNELALADPENIDITRSNMILEDSSFIIRV